MRTEEETTTTFAEDVTFSGCSIPVMKRRQRPNRRTGRGMVAGTKTCSLASSFSVLFTRAVAGTRPETS